MAAAISARYWATASVQIGTCMYVCMYIPTQEHAERVAEVCEWSGVEWSGVEWSGVEWSGVE